MQQNLIGWDDSTSIDIWGRLWNCPGCESQLIKPFELGGRSCIILMSFFQYRIAFNIAYVSQKFNSIFHR
jgi:hypothetical protein